MELQHKTTGFVNILSIFLSVNNELLEGYIFNFIAGEQKHFNGWVGKLQQVFTMLVTWYPQLMLLSLCVAWWEPQNGKLHDLST